jgi:thiamine pyrophosphate-dependent acetolactate synthase large subunit-like protein
MRLAETATKYSYEVNSVDDLSVALQRCYLQARLQPTGPVFLSIPMNFMLERTPADVRFGGVKRTSLPHRKMSAFDPKRTS